jgi:ferredoxin
VGHGWVCVAVVGSILDGDVEGDEVVADDEEDEQEDTVSDEHVEEGESEA